MYRLLFAILSIVVCNISIASEHKLNLGNGLITTFNQQSITFIIKHDTLLIKNASVLLEGYGELLSDSVGKVTFRNVSAPDTIKYIITADKYFDYSDSLIVSDQDMEEIVQLQTEAYSVVFEVTDGNQTIEGAFVSLDGYGSVQTDNNGKAYFTNVLPNDSIFYEVAAVGYGSQTGRIALTNADILKPIQLHVATHSVKFYVAIDTTPVKNAIITFHTYGTKKTNSDGITIFNDVLPGIAQEYTVDVAGYSLFKGALIVGNSDVVEEIIFAAPSYTVLFQVKLNNEAFEGVEVYLEGHGISYTNKFGTAQYLNVLPAENIPYYIKTEIHGGLSGGVTIKDSDASVIVEFTGINDKEIPALPIYPNPASDKFIFEAPNNGELLIINLSGKILFKQAISEGQNTIQLDGFKNGIYSVRFKSEKQLLVNKLIITQ